MREHRSLEVASLFSGVGGFELGLARAGWRTASFCEIDPEAAAVLAARFPRAALTRDIRRLDETAETMPASAGLLAAGFPCTDLSQAGRTAGFEGAASSLVRDALDLLARRPFAHVLLENVPNWRALHGGRYLAEVVGALERLGYRWAYRTIDARAFGAPQRRLRLFLYASLEADPSDALMAGDVAPDASAYPLTERAHGFYWTEGVRGLGWGEDCTPTLKGGSTVGVPSPPAILLPGGAVVTPAIEDAERLQGLPPGWTALDATLEGARFRARRRWVLVGNAVNVDAAAWVGGRIAAPPGRAVEPGAALEPGARWPAAASFDGRLRRVETLGAWPEAQPRPPLAEFLAHPPAPLSARATAGFLGRLARSALRLPPGFVAALEAHFERQEHAEGRKAKATA